MSFQANNRINHRNWNIKFGGADAAPPVPPPAAFSPWLATYASGGIGDPKVFTAQNAPFPVWSAVTGLEAEPGNALLLGNIGANLYAYVGQDIYSSLDGQTWSIVPGTNLALGNISTDGTNRSASNGSVIVTWNPAGAGRELRSSSDGITWTLRESGQEYTSVLFSGNEFCIANNRGPSPARVTYSSDGVNFTSSLPVFAGPLTGGLDAVAKISGVYVGVGTGVNPLPGQPDNPFWYSADGVNFTSGAAVTAGALRAFAIAQSPTSIVTYTNQSSIYRTTDGINWSEVNIFAQLGYYDVPTAIGYYDDVYTIITGMGYFIYSLDDGLSWVNGGLFTPGAVLGLQIKPNCVLSS